MATPTTTRLRSLPPAVARHLAAALLAAMAVFSVGWFLVLDPQIVGIFARLADPWALGNGEFDWFALLWAVAGVALFGVLGWFLLDNFEVYLPRSAAAALALILGLSLAGWILELLAIPHWLGRRTIAFGLGLLLGLLYAGAWRCSRRPTESGLGGETGPDQQRLRRAMARQAHDRTLHRPRRLGERVYRTFALVLIGAITFFNFWHALLYPEVYWDSLILYLGHARMTFLEHGFPVKVVGQVGIGLGANYPHLFPAVGAGIATAMGEWSELPQRFIAPLCGVASTILVYHSALRLTRHVNAAISVALLYRSIPLGIAYDQYASDYALALLFAAAFLYLALRAIESGLRGYLALGALLIALAMHLNYLMGVLWLPWGIAGWLAHVGWRRDDDNDNDNGDAVPGADPDAPWTALPRRRGRRGLLGDRRLWLTLLLAGLIGSTWFVRNWVVTGNPVYAFFYKQLGGIHINPAVMEASAREWQNNGAGIGGFTEQVAAASRRAFANQPPSNWLEEWLNPTANTPLSRPRLLPEFLIGSPRWRQGYRLMPLVGGFALGGGLVWLALWLASPLVRNRPVHRRIAVRFGLVVVSLAGSLLVFHLVLAPFYLYQIIKLLPCLALLAALAWPLWRPAPWRWLFGALALWIGLVPGLAFALMGFKLPAPSLHALRNPLPLPHQMYTWRFGGDAAMWAYIDMHLRGRRILTHENRHLVFHPSVELVHLDDWEIQPLWLNGDELRKFHGDDPTQWPVPHPIDDPAERVRRLVDDFDIHYYLYVPNEDNTATNARMGAREWESLGLARLEFSTENPPNRLYRLTPRD
jgi:hypothetical protein